MICRLINKLRSLLEWSVSFSGGSLCEGSELKSKFIIETSVPEKGLKEKMITELVTHQQVAFRKGLSGGAIKGELLKRM